MIQFIKAIKEIIQRAEYLMSQWKYTHEVMLS